MGSGSVWGTWSKPAPLSTSLTCGHRWIVRHLDTARYCRMFQVYLMNCMAAAGRPEEAGAACFEEIGLDYEPVQVRILLLTWLTKQTIIPTLTTGLC